MSEERKVFDNMGLDDDTLDTVTGGSGRLVGAGPGPVTPAPMPTGSVTYTCTCGCPINASTRDMYVTCPKCHLEFKVKKGELIPK